MDRSAPRSSAQRIGDLHTMEQPRQAHLVGERTDGCERAGQQHQRTPERIADRVRAGPGPHERSGDERAQVERIDVELCRHLRIGGEHHLEPTIEAEAVGDIGTHPPADPVAGLQHHDRATGLVRGTGRRESHKPRADHDDVDSFGQRVLGRRHDGGDDTHRRQFADRSCSEVVNGSGGQA